MLLINTSFKWFTAFDNNLIITNKKEYIMKKILISIIVIIIASVSILINGCAATKDISEKSGALLWGENCNRCHNGPSKDQYSVDQWDIIGSHMKIRANVTDAEERKIVTFLQTGQ